MTKAEFVEKYMPLNHPVYVTLAILIHSQIDYFVGETVLFSLFCVNGDFMFTQTRSSKNKYHFAHGLL